MCNNYRSIPSFFFGIYGSPEHKAAIIAAHAQADNYNTTWPNSNTCVVQRHYPNRNKVSIKVTGRNGVRITKNVTILESTETV